MNVSSIRILVLCHAMLIATCAPIAASFNRPSTDWTVVFSAGPVAVSTMIEDVNLIAVFNDTLVFGYDDGVALRVNEIPVSQLVTLDRPREHWRWLGPSIGMGNGIGVWVALGLGEHATDMGDFAAKSAAFFGLIGIGYLIGALTGNMVADAAEHVDFHPIAPDARSELLRHIIEFDELPESGSL